ESGAGDHRMAPGRIDCHIRSSDSASAETSACASQKPLDRPGLVGSRRSSPALHELCCMVKLMNYSTSNNRRGRVSMSSAGTRHNRPPFRADRVGSRLRPKRLFDARMAFDGAKLDTLKSGEGRSSPQLRPFEDEAIRDAVALQERVGLKSITDGEFRRRAFHQDF